MDTGARARACTHTHTHTHTPHPTKSFYEPYFSRSYMGWCQIFPSSLYSSSSPECIIWHLLYPERHKVIWLTKPSTPATTKPKHSVPHWDSDKAEGHFLRAIWYPALHIAWAKLPRFTVAVFFLFLSVDTAQLFGYRILLVNYFPLLPCYQDYVYIFFTWMKLFRTLFLKTLISNSKLCWDYHEQFWA